MGTITSDSSIANQYATGIQTATDQLSAIGEAEKDSQTTLQGNQLAHAAMDKSKTLLDQVVSAVSTASSNLHSVASDFEAVDAASAESFEG